MRSRRSANQRYHDRVAGKYEAVYDDAYWQWHDDLTWDYLKRHLPADANAPVADLGCGSGKWGRKLIKSGFRVTFVDLSPKMIDEAHRHVAQAGGGQKADYLQADLMDLSALPADHFALALAMGEPIGLAADPQVALRQIARCLAPAGVLVATLDSRVPCVDYYLEKGQIDELECFLHHGRTHWLTRNPSERFDVHTFKPDQIKRMVAAAGLEMLELIGKTVLPMRRYREQLHDAGTRRRWAAVEKRLARDPANLARCPHLQFAARKPRRQP